MRHLARTPYMSLTYWDPRHQQVYVECAVAVIETAAEKRRVWDFFKSTPAPLGYDPATIWKSADDADFALLRLTPSRIELSGAGADGAPAQPVVWRSP